MDRGYAATVTERSCGFPASLGTFSPSATGVRDRSEHLFPEIDEAVATSFDLQIAEAQLSRQSNVVHAAFAS